MLRLLPIAQVAHKESAQNRTSYFGRFLNVKFLLHIVFNWKTEMEN